MLGKMFHNFEMGEGIFMKLWHNVILINSERFWEFGGCGHKKPGCHTLLKIGVLGLKTGFDQHWLSLTVCVYWSVLDQWD